MRASSLAEFCTQFGVPVPDDIVTIKNRQYYNPKKLDFPDASSLGIMVGDSRKGFHPTPALLDVIAPNIKKRVVVDEKAAWLFLCGRDVLSQGVWETDEFEKGELALVKDEEDNVLGFGIVYQPIKRGTTNVYIKNLLDKGNYLRRER